MATLADLEGQAEQLARDLRAAGDVPAVLAPPYFTADALRERLCARPVPGQRSLRPWLAASHGRRDAPRRPPELAGTIS